MRVEEVEQEDEARCEQRFVTVDDVGGIQCPARQDLREEAREPQDQARDADHADAPEDREVVELLPVRPAVECGARAEIQEVLQVRPQVLDVLEVRRHRAPAPEVAFLALEHDVTEQHRQVHGEVAERDDRREAMQEARDLRPAQRGHQARRPGRRRELERQAGHREQQEAQDDRHVQPHLRGREPSHVRPRPEMLDLELAAQAADQRALQPQQCMQAEEAEHAEQQQRHEQVDVVHPWVLRSVHRIAVRHEGQERRVDLAFVAAARAAGGREVVRMRRRARVARRQVVVRRVAVRAHGRRAVADGRGFAVKAVMERLVEVLVAIAAVARHVRPHRSGRRILDRVRLVAGAADRAVLAFPPQRAVRALVPLLEDALVAFAAGLGAHLVRGARAGGVVPLDVVAAVAVAAGWRGIRKTRDEQGPGVHAGEITLHHVFVADAAVANLVERRHRRSRVVAADEGVHVAVTAFARPGLASLDLGVDAALERRDLVLVAFHAHVEGHGSEGLALAFVLHAQGRRVATDAIELLVR